MPAASWRSIPARGPISRSCARSRARRRGSLLAAIDRTVTPNGQRLLAERLAGPSTAVAVIGRRADAVAFLVDDATFRRQLREASPRPPRRIMMRPLEPSRACSRGGPRDLAAISRRSRRRRAPSVEVLARLADGLGEELETRARRGSLAAPFSALAEALDDGAGVDDLPLLQARRRLRRVTGMVDPELDELRANSRPTAAA